MHLWQAIKMACKSLWTNKMRSFLTMLGIIIGVMTVSLLTTVASGVSNAVVSSIRSQSTLAVMMNMSNTLNYQTAKEVIESVRPEDKNAEDYFDYSLAVASSSIVMNESLDGVTDEQIEDYLMIDPEKKFSESDLNKWKAENQTKYGVAMMIMSLKARGIARQTSINMVDKNYAEVYDLKYFGEFPKNSDEILVDEEFIETYLPRYNKDTVMGKEVTLGITSKIVFTITFQGSALSSEEQEAIVSNFSGYVNGINPLTQQSQTNKVSLNVLGSDFSDSNKAVIEVETCQNFNNKLTEQELAKDFAETYSKEEVSVEIKDVYNSEKAKTYKVVGVINEEENASLFTNMAGMDSSEFEDDANMVELMRALYPSNGECYMLLDDANIVVLGGTKVDSSRISYAYFRYKTEDVMTKSTNNLSLAFLGKGAVIMRDYMLISMSSVANIISKVMNILTIMLTVISVISLVVGGIGIMNIMLVAVSERTREIGIRKAIGAKKSSILTQFLVEALMLSIVGGAIGLIISAIGSAIIGSVMGISMAMPFWVIAMSIGFCTAIGLIFGMFPAVKASNMQPIDALRRE